MPASPAAEWFEALWSTCIAIDQPADIDKAHLKFMRRRLAAKLGAASKPVDETSDLLKEDLANDPQLKAIFTGISVRRAIILTLSLYRRPMSALEVSKQLEAGGLETAARQLSYSVHDALRDGQRSQVFVNVGRGQWGLASWSILSQVEAEPYIPKPKRKTFPGGKSSIEK